MLDRAQTDREVRAAQNQSLFREVNERLEVLADGSRPSSGMMTFACECADTSCIEQIYLSVSDYEAVRATPTHFAVRPSHVFPYVEDVVSKSDAYFVVEKRNAGPDFAAGRDSRGTGGGH